MEVGVLPARGRRERKGVAYSVRTVETLAREVEDGERRELRVDDLGVRLQAGGRSYGCGQSARRGRTPARAFGVWS